MSEQPESSAMDVVEEAIKETTKAPEKDEVELLLESLATEEHLLTLEEHPFKVKGPDGTVVSYKLREMDANRRGQYLSYQAGIAKLGAKGNVVGFGDIKGMEIKAVELSVFDKDNIPLPYPVIAAFPGKLINKLAKIALRISGLDEGAEARAKNS